MHTQQMEFCQRVLDMHPQYRSGVRVLDCGSLDVNGNNRQWFNEPFTYIGIDLAPGRNVDVVSCASKYTDYPFDVVISTEMLEHCSVWKEAVRNMIELTRRRGLLLLTWAGPGRGEHGTRRNSPESSPFTNDYYKEISAEEFEEVAQPSEWSSNYLLHTRASPSDVYFFGVKNRGMVLSDFI